MTLSTQPAVPDGPCFDAGSYRDRTSRVFRADGNVYRALDAQALRAWEMLAGTALFARLTAEEKLPATWPVGVGDWPTADGAEPWAGCLQHAALPFVSYPFEWTFAMLRDAALLQLELVDAALDEGMILKDASAYNVQWQGACPQFIDLGSFVPYQPGQLWPAYRQFCELFLNPLLLTAYRNVPFQPWLRGCLDGIPVAQCRALLSWRDLFRPGVFRDVVLHSELQQAMGDGPGDLRANLARAGFGAAQIQANVRRLTRIVRKLEWRAAQSHWSGYDRNNSYTDADREIKEDFVRQAAFTRPYRLAWDLGCNTGRLARVAAENAAYVVALDGDAGAVDRLYRALHAEGCRRIQPLVCNLADMAGGLGWRGRERLPLPERGRPDLVLSLALIHHLVISANIPLPAVVEWLAELGGDLVIEFVRRNDPMVEKLLRHKDETYPDYDEALFEACLARHFDVRQRRELTSGRRVLYFACRRAS